MYLSRTVAWIGIPNTVSPVICLEYDVFDIETLESS